MNTGDTRSSDYSSYKVMSGVKSHLWGLGFREARVPSFRVWGFRGYRNKD